MKVMSHTLTAKFQRTLSWALGCTGIDVLVGDLFCHALSAASEGNGRARETVTAAACR